MSAKEKNKQTEISMKFTFVLCFIWALVFSILLPCWKDLGSFQDTIGNIEISGLMDTKVIKGIFMPLLQLIW